MFNLQETLTKALHGDLQATEEIWQKIAEKELTKKEIKDIFELSQDINFQHASILKAFSAYILVCYFEEYSYAIKLCEQIPQDSYSLFLRGYIHHFGPPEYNNHTLAMEFYERSAALENPRALYNLGDMYVGKQIPDYAMAKQFYEQASTLTYSLQASSAILRLGVINLLKPANPAVKPNYQAAKALFLTLINNFNQSDIENAVKHNKKDVAEALEYLMGMACVGQGEPNNEPNFPTALTYYQRLLELGSSKGKFLRALMYLQGENEPANQPNYRDAISVLEQAIEQNCFHSMKLRAQMHAEGQGGKDLVQAATLFRHSYVLAIKNKAEAVARDLEKKLERIYHRYYLSSKIVTYHCCLVHQDIHAIDFLAGIHVSKQEDAANTFSQLIAEDKLLEQQDKIILLKKILRQLPNHKFTQGVLGQLCLNLAKSKTLAIESCYERHSDLRELLLTDENEIKRLESELFSTVEKLKLEEQNLYFEVPKKSKHYGEASYELMLYHYRSFCDQQDTYEKLSDSHKFKVSLDFQIFLNCLIAGCEASYLDSLFFFYLLFQQREPDLTNFTKEAPDAATINIAVDLTEGNGALEMFYKNNKRNLYGLFNLPQPKEQELTTPDTVLTFRH